MTPLNINIRGKKVAETLEQSTQVLCSVLVATPLTGEPGAYRQVSCGDGGDAGPISAYEIAVTGSLLGKVTLVAGGLDATHTLIAPCEQSVLVTVEEGYTFTGIPWAIDADGNMADICIVPEGDRSYRISGMNGPGCLIQTQVSSRPGCPEGEE